MALVWWGECHHNNEPTISRGGGGVVGGRHGVGRGLGEWHYASADPRHGWLVVVLFVVCLIFAGGRGAGGDVHVHARANCRRDFLFTRAALCSALPCPTKRWWCVAAILSSGQNAHYFCSPQPTSWARTGFKSDIPDRNRNQTYQAGFSHENTLPSVCRWFSPKWRRSRGGSVDASRCQPHEKNLKTNPMCPFGRHRVHNKSVFQRTHWILLFRYVGINNVPLIRSMFCCSKTQWRQNRNSDVMDAFGAPMNFEIANARLKRKTHLIFDKFADFPNL